MSTSIGPIAIFADEGRYKYMFVKVAPDDMRGTIAFMEETAKSFNPDVPFEYHFLDEDFERMYLGAERLITIVKTFTLLAIVISCLGLFGLAAFMAEMRTKEIGVRKVMGASIPGIMFLFCKEFIKWVIIANVVAWPLSYLLMKGWLQNFAYRIRLGPEIFLISAGIALAVSIATVSYQTVKAARANPVESLRYE